MIGTCCLCFWRPSDCNTWIKPSRRLHTSCTNTTPAVHDRHMKPTNTDIPSDIRVLPPHTVTSWGEFCPWQRDTPHSHDPCEPLLHQYTGWGSLRKLPVKNALSETWCPPLRTDLTQLIHDLCSLPNTGLFEMIVGVLTTCHLVLQMQPHVISFYGVTPRIRFMFLLFPQVSRNWRYESEPPLKPSPLTCYKQFGTNSIIVLMFVESQRVHI